MANQTHIDIQYRGHRIHPAMEGSIRQSLVAVAAKFDLLRKINAVVDLTNVKRAKVTIVAQIGDDETQEFQATNPKATKAFDAAIAKLETWMRAQRVESAGSRSKRLADTKRRQAILGVCVCILFCIFVFRQVLNRPTTLDLVPTAGQVLRNGVPVPRAGVTIIPIGDNGQFNGMGFTDEEGRFVIRTRGQVGAMPGEYRAIINKYLMPDGSEFIPDADQSPLDVGANESIPYQFSDMLDSELTLRITAPEAMDLVVALDD